MARRVAIRSGPDSQKDVAAPGVVDIAGATKSKQSEIG